MARFMIWETIFPRLTMSMDDDVHAALKAGWMNSIEAALETAVRLDL